LSISKIAPFQEAEMLRLARRAVGKIDRMGKRGATLITLEEIEAMATTLACLGVVPAKTTEGEPT